MLSASRAVAGQCKHYSIRTEEAYADWIKRYIDFHDVRHPAEMGGPEVQAFLTHRAAEGNVAASTQNPCTERSEVRPSARCSFSTARCFTRISAPLTPRAQKNQNACSPS
jgi:hypothetical protein